jgi:hypothetical protein
MSNSTKRCPICDQQHLDVTKQIYHNLTTNESSDNVEHIWNNSIDEDFYFSPTFFDNKNRQLVITNSTPIGQGGTARVFRANDVNGSAEYAVKLFDHNGLVAQGDKSWNDLHREIHLSIQAEGIPNVCLPLGFAKLSGSYNGRPCLIYPCLRSTPSDLPSLRKHIHVGKNATLLKRALQALHKRGLVHGDMHYTWKNVCWTADSKGKLKTPYLIDLSWSPKNNQSLASASSADLRSLENMILILRRVTSHAKYNLDKRLANADEERAEAMITRFLKKLAQMNIREPLEMPR